jgi:glycine dehydrogenase
MNKTSDFLSRHNGPRNEQHEGMLRIVKAASLDALIDDTVPANIRLQRLLDLPEASTEVAALDELYAVAQHNRVTRSFIGTGYSDCVTPAVILRNIMENPSWYTAYTPYQAEIAQGRLEALLNFQTMVCDLTGMEVTGASLLDEGTAAAEAMAMCLRLRGEDSPKRFIVADDCHPQTIDVVRQRAEPLGVTVVVVDVAKHAFGADDFGVLVQSPNTEGRIVDVAAIAAAAKKNDVWVTVATDLLACTMVTPRFWRRKWRTRARCPAV